MFRTPVSQLQCQKQSQLQNKRLIMSTPEIQYCDQEIVPLCAERRYQPIRIAYLLSLSLLIGASIEIPGAERTLLLFSQFWASF